MKIVLIAPTYLPARRANTIQVMKMAQALAIIGHDLQVLVPRSTATFHQPSWKELSHHYGLQQPFDIKWLPAVPHLRSYDYGVKSVIWAKRWGADLIYTRLPQAAAIASLVKLPSIYEIHDLPQGTLGPWLLKCFLKGAGTRLLVVITAFLRDALSARYALPKSLPLIVAPDAVDLARYKNLASPLETRQSFLSDLKINDSEFVAGYTGHLYPGRGTEMILDIAELLPDIRFLLVGGESADEARLRLTINSRNIENISLTGFVPNAELPLYQAACDILLMPYQQRVAASSGGDIAKFLSPMKLFEYMACGRAILSSDLPVLLEILNPENAILLPPDDISAWVAAIQDLRTNLKKRAQLGTNAKRDAQLYSWENRASKILSVLDTIFTVSNY